jgi:hypothetical protein
VAPADGAAAAESGIGEQAHGGDDTGFPREAGFGACELSDKPESCVGGELEARGAMHFVFAGIETIHGSVRAQRQPEGAAGGTLRGRQQAFARAVHIPASLLEGAAVEQARDDALGKEARGASEEL